MLKKDLVEKIKDLADDANVDEILQGIDGLAKPFNVANATVADYKSMLENNPVVKAYYQSSFDSAVGTAVTKHDEKFKREKLPGLIEEAIKAKSNEGKTPEQIQLQELQNQLNEMKAEKEKAEKLNSNTKLLQDKNLPIGLAKYINDENDVTEFENIIAAAVQKGINKKLGSHDETPPIGGTLKQKMTLSEIMDYANKHPEVNVQELINQNR